MRSLALRRQTGVELSLTLRRGESLLLALGIPVLLLVFFSSVDVLPRTTDDPIDFLAPGILSLAVMSTAMVGLGIATGFERQYLVLKRLGATPLGRGGLLTAKTLSTIAVIVLQLVVLTALAYALGWRPDAAGWPAALAAMALAAIAFAGTGLLMAGTLKGEVNLAAANGLYLVLLLLGDVVFPLDRLPSGLEALCRLLPMAALSDIVRAVLTTGHDVRAESWVVLVVWAVAAPLAAARWFRWE